ncbi:MAG TPA: hypothetical protein VL172_12760 [Kofleriaceae bacterium]|nr:hypothetical protein [Kofleriaceae bacterium]
MAGADGGDVPVEVASEPAEEVTVVAVLPLAASESQGMYSKPVADEVARQLSSRAGAGIKAESLSLEGSVPARIALVIDGRIVAAGRRKVALEARVRDPRRGTILIETVATAPRALTDIDVLAADLAGAIAPRLAGAIRDQKKQVAAERHQMRQAMGGGEMGHIGDTTVMLPPKPDPRPPLLVLPAHAPGVDPDILTRHGYWIAERLGYRPVSVPPKIDVKLADVPRVLADFGAQYALAIDLLAMKLDRRGVLTARGRTHVVLYDRSGRPLFDRIARTGTLVGSRGDGPPALVHFVGEQTADIVYPYLKRLIGK